MDALCIIIVGLVGVLGTILIFYQAAVIRDIRAENDRLHAWATRLSAALRTRGISRGP